MGKYTEKQAIEISEKTWEKLMAFSGYGFNKSHAAAYSIMSYWSQWLKVNYPLEFWTISLQEANEADIPFRLAEIKKTGIEIEIRPPDINFSEYNFTCDDKENRIFYSLLKIKGVGEVAVKNIIETRNNGGKFFSLDDFVSRVPSKVNKGNIEKLILSGAFDLIENVKQQKDRIKLLKWYVVDYKGADLPEIYLSNEAKNNSFWILEQKRLTGFGDIDYETMIRNKGNKKMSTIFVDGSMIGSLREGTEVCVAGKLILLVERSIKNGTMASLNLDSNNTIISVTAWPDFWESIENPEAIKNKVICLNGIVKKDKFKNAMCVYTNEKSKLYILSEND